MKMKTIVQEALISETSLNTEFKKLKQQDVDAIAYQVNRLFNKEVIDMIRRDNIKGISSADKMILLYILRNYSWFANVASNNEEYNNFSKFFSYFKRYYNTPHLKSFDLLSVKPETLYSVFYSILNKSLKVSSKNIDDKVRITTKEEESTYGVIVYRIKNKSELDKLQASNPKLKQVQIPYNIERFNMLFVDSKELTPEFAIVDGIGGARVNSYGNNRFHPKLENSISDIKKRVSLRIYKLIFAAYMKNEQGSRAIDKDDRVTSDEVRYNYDNYFYNNELAFKFSDDKIANIPYAYASESNIRLSNTNNFPKNVKSITISDKSLVNKNTKITDFPDRIDVLTVETLFPDNLLDANIQNVSVRQGYFKVGDLKYIPDGIHFETLYLDISTLQKVYDRPIADVVSFKSRLFGSNKFDNIHADNIDFIHKHELNDVQKKLVDIIKKYLKK